MGLVRENYQGERPEHTLPISDWVWRGSSGVLPHQPLRPHRWTWSLWPSVSPHSQECVAVHDDSERKDHPVTDG